MHRHQAACTCLHLPSLLASLAATTFTFLIQLIRTSRGIDHTCMMPTRRVSSLIGPAHLLLACCLPAACLRLLLACACCLPAACRWAFPSILSKNAIGFNVSLNERVLKRFHTYIQNQSALTSPSDFGGATWSDVQPLTNLTAIELGTDPKLVAAQRILFYWTIR
jgi:hypothetical protein